MVVAQDITEMVMLVVTLVLFFLLTWWLVLTAEHRWPAVHRCTVEHQQMMMRQTMEHHAIGLMVKVGCICLAVDPDGIADNAGPDDKTLRDGCVN